jgi:hypothetical protein
MRRITLMMEAVTTSEMFVNINQTRRCNITADSPFHGVTRPDGCGWGRLYPNMGLSRTDPGMLNKISQPEIMHTFADKSEIR